MLIAFQRISFDGEARTRRPHLLLTSTCRCHQVQVVQKDRVMGVILRAGGALSLQHRVNHLCRTGVSHLHLLL